MKEDAEELSKLAKRVQDVLQSAQVDLGARASTNARAVSAVEVGGVSGMHACRLLEALSL